MHGTTNDYPSRMLDESEELVRDGGHQPERRPILVTWRARDEGSSRLGHATKDARLLGRHASRIEILVALGIVLFGLLFICKARGDEHSPVRTVNMNCLRPGGSPPI